MTNGQSFPLEPTQFALRQINGDAGAGIPRGGERCRPGWAAEQRVTELHLQTARLHPEGGPRGGAAHDPVVRGEPSGVRADIWGLYCAVGSVFSAARVRGER